MCHITIRGGEMPPEEQAAYVRYVTEKYGREPNGLTIRIDGDEAELDVRYYSPFVRIRRLTGYLGTLPNFQ